MKIQKILANVLRRQGAVYLIAAALLISGFYFTKIMFLDKEWLTRAGCLIVILGIWSGLGGVLQEQVLLGKLQLLRRFAISSAKRRHHRSQDSDRLADEEIAAIEENFAEREEFLKNNLKLSVGVTEVSLLIIGTFFWGFGDLIMLFG